MNDERSPFLGFWYIVLFIFSFLFFLYLTFPYGVLKESILAQVSREAGVNIQMKGFGPSLPLGFEAEGITITSADGDASIDLDSIDISISLLSFLIGNLSVDAEVLDKTDGELEVTGTWSLLSLITAFEVFPKGVALDSDNFAIGQPMNFVLKKISKTSNDLVKPVLNKITINGKLKGTAEISLDAADPAGSIGEINLQVNEGILDMNDPNLNLAPQKFKKALVKASFAAGSLKLDPTSGFHTQELFIDMTGNAKAKNPMQRSVLDFAINLKLTGNLKENFGFVLSMVGGSETELKYRLNGTLDRPSFRSL